MSGETRCSKGHTNASETKFCGDCGEKLALQCPGCNAVVATAVKFCGECGAPLNSAAGGNEVTAVSAGGGTTIGDVGIIKDSTISSTTNVHHHVGHGGHGLAGSFNPIFNLGHDAKHVTKVGEKCPICRKLVKVDYFECPKCGRDFICLSHRHDSKPYYCEDCIEELSEVVRLQQEKDRKEALKRQEIKQQQDEQKQLVEERKAEAARKRQRDKQSAGELHKRLQEVQKNIVDLSGTAEFLSDRNPGLAQKLRAEIQKKQNEEQELRQELQQRLESERETQEDSRLCDLEQRLQRLQEGLKQ